MDFVITTMTNSSVFNLYLEKESLFLDPPYQRLGDIWPLSKRQLLVDSVINGFDIPKFYFHQYFPIKKIKDKKYRYAIIDGKQRLQSLWDFIDNKFALEPSFEYLHDKAVKLGGLKYTDIAASFPRIKSQFDATLLTVVCIQTEDPDLIEDMFSRLNEAAPLSAAERRNAFGGPLPSAIRNLARHGFFQECLPFGNRRFRHFDLVCKILLVTSRGDLEPTYKIDLDQFVDTYETTESTANTRKLSQSCRVVLDQMRKVFHEKDDLLRSAGVNVLYYWLCHDAMKHGWLTKFKRTKLEAFREKCERNRRTAERDIRLADYELLEFDRLTQSPNDGPSMKYRFGVLRKALIG